jgi:spore germination protein YaaH
MRLSVFVLTTVLAAAATAPAAQACTGAGHLEVARPAPGVAVLSWTGPAGTWRVARSGRTVGQTTRRRMPVRVSPGRRATFTVARVTSGRVSCPRALATVVRRLRFGTPEGVTLTQVSRTGVTLNWRAGRPGDGRLAGYRLYRDGRPLGQVQATRWRVATAVSSAGVLELAAVDTHGHESRRARVAAPQASYRAPLPPPGLRAGHVSSTSAVLSWDPAQAGSAHASAYRVYRDGALLATTRRRRIRVPVDRARLRHFRVSAVDGRAYESDLSLPVAVTGASRAPGPPVGLAVEEMGEASATLSWFPSFAPGGAPRGYRVYRDGALARLTTARRVTIGLTDGRAHRMAVVATGPRSRRSPSAALTLSGGHRPPAAPVDLVASVASGGQATVAWETAAPGSAPVVRYRVYRDGALVAITSALQATVAVPAARASTVAVRSEDGRGYLSPAAAVPVSDAYRPPGAPGGLALTDMSDTAFTLSWSPAAPGSAPVRGYRVFRDGVVVGQVQGTSMRLTKLFPSRRYVLQVVAADTSGVLGEPSAPLESTTALPPQSTGTAYAFLLASTDSSFADLRAHYRQVGTVVPTYFDCSAGGAIVGRDDPLVTGWAQLRGIGVEPRVNCQDTLRLHRILTDPAVRRAAIDRILALAQQHGYDGINIDFEAGAAGDRDALSSFARDLSGRLHAVGKTISIDVSAKTREVANHPRSTFFDYLALSEVCDRVIVMAWGLHWATSAPGAQDPIGWVRDVVAYAMSLPADNRVRFVLGTQLYAMDWVGGGGPSRKAETYDYATALARSRGYGAEPTYDSVTDAWRLVYAEPGGQHEVWFPDAGTIRNRLRLATSHGMPVALWRLGQEDQRLWADALLGGA